MLTSSANVIAPCLSPGLVNQMLLINALLPRLCLAFKPSWDPLQHPNVSRKQMQERASASTLQAEMLGQKESPWAYTLPITPCLLLDFIMAYASLLHVLMVWQMNISMFGDSFNL